jgi:hypothetical protein
MKVHNVTPFRVIHLQSYGVTERGNVTSVYPRLQVRTLVAVTMSFITTLEGPLGEKTLTLTLILLTWRICCVPYNAGKWT